MRQQLIQGYIVATLAECLHVLAQEQHVKWDFAPSRGSTLLANVGNNGCLFKMLLQPGKLTGSFMI